MINSREYSAKWRDAHRDGVRKYHREYQRNRRRKLGIALRGPKWTPERQLDYFLRGYYDISLVQYNQLLDKQNGGCGICGRKPPFGKFKRLSVDHSHITGEVRGLLCMFCNSFLGRIEDDASKVSRYLGGD
jgi:Recombination endonuclease VII